MKIAAICGSPRKNGNTDKVLVNLEEILGSQHQFDKIRVTSYQINGCLGCYACSESDDKPACIQKDDTLSLIERIMGADVVIYASPLYSWGFTPQMKALIDRHFCLIKGLGTPNIKSLINEKKVALLVTCDGQIENNADLIQIMFERVSEIANTNIIGKYIVPCCADPNVIATKGLDTATTMASEIMESLKK